MFRFAVLVLLSLQLLAGCMLCPARPMPPIREAWWLDGRWAHEASSLVPHEKAVFGRLPNGFRYVILPNRKPEGRVALHLNVQVGSLMEQAHELGVAHFLEHMAFNGSRHFAPGELIPFFQRNGMAFGQDLNAHTGPQETVYKLNIAGGDSDNFHTALRFLRDVADGLDIQPTQVERERGVILAEKAARDSIDNRAAGRLRKKLYAGTRFNQAPIGDATVIRTVSPETLRDFYRAWYRPELMVLVVVGDLEPAAVEERIREAFQDFQAQAPRRELASWGDVGLNGTIPFHDFYEAESTFVRFSALHPRVWQDDTPESRRQWLHNSMAAGILSRRLQQLVADGRAPFLRGMVQNSRAYNLLPSLHVVGVCPAPNWQETFRDLQDELSRVLEHGFLAEEVEQLRTEWMRGFETQARNEGNLLHDQVVKAVVHGVNSNQVLQSAGQALEYYRPLLQEVTAADLHAAFSGMWQTEHRLVAVTGNADLGPDADQKLLDMWRDGRQRAMVAPVDPDAVGFPYLDVPAVAGRVAARRSLPVPGTDLLLHELDFANGLRVRLLPTPFQQGRVALDLHLGGGHSGVTDDQFVAARLAFMTDAQSGFGRLSALDALRLQRATGAGAGSRLARHATIISSEGETADLAGMLEAMWTQYREPEIAREDLENLLKTLAMADLKRGRDVPSVAEDESARFFYGDGLRTRPLTEAMAREQELTVLRRHLQALHRGGDPVLNVVGDFSPEEAEALVARFFGAEEVTYPAAVPADYAHVPSFPAPAHRQKTLQVEAELGQAELRLAWLRRLEDVGDRKALAVRRLLAAVIRERLRVRVREELGMVYAPDMFYRYTEDNGHGFFLVRIATRPDHLARLREVVEKEVVKVAAHGVTAEQLERQRLPMRRNWEKSRTENRTYIHLLNAMARNQHPHLQWTAEAADVLDSITVEDLNGEARVVFRDENLAVLQVTEPIQGESKEP